MAKVLLIESATTMCSVAIVDGDKILAAQQTNDGFTHAENLTEFIQQVSQQSIVLNDIDAVVVNEDWLIFITVASGAEIDTATVIAVGVGNLIVANHHIATHTHQVHTPVTGAG